MRDNVIQDVIEWDINNWSHTLYHWNKAITKIPKTHSKILCLGERNGGLSLWFALQGFQVVCSDFMGPREEAIKLHARYGVSSLVQYADISIFKIPFADNTFDVVACKSVIGGLKLDYNDKKTRTLGNQKLAINEVRRVLKPGGYFLGAENMQGSWFHCLVRKVLKGDKIGWRHFKVDELQWLLRDFSDHSIHFYGFFGTFYSKRILNWILGLIDSGISKIVPSKILYIGFIIAKK